MPIRKYDKNEPYARRAAYARMKAQARYRGEPWEFKFETWIQMWDEHNLWHLRGRAGDSYCMKRIDTEKPWSPDNTAVMIRKLVYQK